MAIYSKRKRLHTEALEDRTQCKGDFAPVMPDSPRFADSAGCEDQNRHSEISIPEYSSKPGAPATLYLDFRGHTEAGQENEPAGGPYANFESSEVELVGGASHDGTDKSNSIEVRVIKEIWQTIAEKFAQLNVNVTTVHPGDFSAGKMLRVAVGGLFQDCYRSMLQYR